MANKKQYKDYCIFNRLVDTKTFKLTGKFLEKICVQAKKLMKKPLLILSLKRDDETIYKLECEVSQEKFKQK